MPTSSNRGSIVLPEIRLIAAQWEALRRHLLQDNDEHAAVLMCGFANPLSPVLTCRSVVALDQRDVAVAEGGLHIEVAPLAIARLAKKARLAGLTMVLCHSHPIEGQVRPSQVDMATEEDLCGRALYERLHHRPIGSLIVGPDGASARIWEGQQSMTAGVRVVGDVISMIGADSDRLPAEAGQRDIASAYDRQIMIWGHAGQRRLAATRVAVIGVGGTGSHVATQLSHLGIGGFLLIDPDIVEPTNRSRILGSDARSIGQPKVVVLADHIHRINPAAAVETEQASVIDIDPSILATVDIILCCTDGHGSRLLLTEIAQQFLVPVIDMGIEIQSDLPFARAGGGVRLLRPGSACLHCMGVLDARLIREEFLSDAERRAEDRRGYLRTASIDAPSVVALNGVVASLAVVELMDQLLGVFAAKPDRLLYRAEARALSVASVVRDPRCYVCGSSGLLGLGSSRLLPRRQSRAG